MKRLNSIVLWICLLLFMVRVVGQIYIGLYPNLGAIYALPSWDEWYSGLLPYPLLLISQIVVIQLLTLMAYDYTRQSGLFFLESLKIQRSVRFVSILYFTSMMIRAVFSGGHHLIPISFHFVLALFLFVYSSVEKQSRKKP